MQLLSFAGVKGRGVGDPTRYPGTTEEILGDPECDADSDMDPEDAEADSTPCKETSAGVKGDVFPRPRPRRPRPVLMIRYSTEF